VALKVEADAAPVEPRYEGSCHAANQRNRYGIYGGLTGLERWALVYPVEAEAYRADQAARNPVRAARSRALRAARKAA